MEYSTLSGMSLSPLPSKAQGTLWWKECESWRRGKRAVKCCFLDTTWPVHSWTQCSHGRLHRIKSTRSVNIPAGSTNQTQWVTKQKRRGHEGERGSVGKMPGGVRRGRWGWPRYIVCLYDISKNKYKIFKRKKTESKESPNLRSNESRDNKGHWGVSRCLKILAQHTWPELPWAHLACSLAVLWHLLVAQSPVNHESFPMIRVYRGPGSVLMLTHPETTSALSLAIFFLLFHFCPFWHKILIELYHWSNQ